MGTKKSQSQKTPKGFTVVGGAEVEGYAVRICAFYTSHEEAQQALSCLSEGTIYIGDKRKLHNS